MTDSRDRQVQYYREAVNAEFEITRPRGAGRLYQYFMEFKIAKALRRLGIGLRGRRVLNVCCGSGMDLEFVAREGAVAIGLDLSLDAVRRARERAKRHGFPVLGVVGDAENLPFQTGAVSLGVVHDGLHHLTEPHRAIRELVRVSTDGVLLVEPANAAITRLAVALGVSGDYEDAGNYVYRLTRAELVSLFRSLNIHSVKIRRYLMYYHHEPRSYYRVFDHALPFRIFQALFLATNALVGRWGNKLMCIALKDGAASRR